MDVSLWSHRGMGSLLQKSKRNRRSFQDAKSTKFPNKPFLESAASCPVPKNKENSSLCGIIDAFGGRFMFSKKKHEDTDISSQDASASSSNDGTYKSVGSSFSLSSNSEGTSGVIFTMDDLISATCNFSPSLKIGHGGFGTVYKGRLKDGRFVAVKRAKKNAYDKQVSAEFRNEFATLSNVDHLNLVKFIGYLEEQHEHILVVEYVANGNLRQHLDGDVCIVCPFCMHCVYKCGGKCCYFFLFSIPLRYKYNFLVWVEQYLGKVGRLENPPSTTVFQTFPHIFIVCKSSSNEIHLES